MKAMTLPKFGGPDLFELSEVEKPLAGSGEILVKVIASGTNPVDAKLRQNGSWAKLKPGVILGYDAAGIVEKVGDGVTGFNSGDEVYYTPEIFGNQRGTYAEYNVVQSSYAAFKPKNLSFEDAAAIPLAGGTAWEAVIRRIKIQPGETILIHGAAGGVGSFAVQFAKAAGAKVIASASPQNHDALKKLGADVVFDYHEKDATDISQKETGGNGVDAAFDIQGNEIGTRCIPTVRPFGRIAVILPPKGDFGVFSRNNITLYGVFLTRERKRLDEMTPVFERGLAHPLVDEVLPLKKVSKAHERLDTAHGRGKVILKVAEE